MAYESSYKFAKLIKVKFILTLIELFGKTLGHDTRLCCEYARYAVQTVAYNIPAL